MAAERHKAEAIRSIGVTEGTLTVGEPNMAV